MHKIDLSLLRMYYVYQERQLVHLCVTAGKFWYRKLHMVLAFIAIHTNGFYVYWVQLPKASKIILIWPPKCVI